jgi:hypothetical protein
MFEEILIRKREVKIYFLTYVIVLEEQDGLVPSSSELGPSICCELVPSGSELLPSVIELIPSIFELVSSVSELVSSIGEPLSSISVLADPDNVAKDADKMEQLDQEEMV